MIITSSRQLWLALADLAVLRLCWATRVHSADRRCANWWTGLMLRAAVTAHRGKPIRPLSVVYAGVFFKQRRQRPLQTILQSVFVCFAQGVLAFLLSA